MKLLDFFLNTVKDKEIKQLSLIVKSELDYCKQLKKTVLDLKQTQQIDYRNISFDVYDKSLFTNETYNDLVVMYIISISFLRNNTVIHLSDIKGNMKLFYTSGMVQIKGKRKKNNKLAALKLISLLIKKATFVEKAPVALHLNNVTSYNYLIVKKLRSAFWIKIIKTFYQTPFNGCRKKKVKRKKYSKKLFR